MVATYVRRDDRYRFPLGIDPDTWAKLKDEHKLHPDEGPSWNEFLKFGRYKRHQRYDQEEQLEAPEVPTEDDPSEGMTLQKVAEHFGLTRERVRQIEAKALKKLQKRVKLLGLSMEALMPEPRKAMVVPDW